jgi:S1-C subfamily serine protease
VVWRGDKFKNGPDLAVLYIPTPLDRVFEWTPSYSVEDPVIAVGPNRDEAQVEVVCFAGTIVKILHDSPGSAYQAVIAHTGPARHGDSGGPLLAMNGRLIAINIGTPKKSKMETFGQRARAIAVRPQLAWLQAIVDEHFTSMNSSDALVPIH